MIRLVSTVFLMAFVITNVVCWRLTASVVNGFSWFGAVSDIVMTVSVGIAIWRGCDE